MPEKRQELTAVIPQNRPTAGDPARNEDLPTFTPPVTTAPITEVKDQPDNKADNHDREIQQFLTKNLDDIGGKVMAVLQYPAIARRMKWQGLSSIGFVLHPSGEVTDFSVEKSSGHEILDKHAIAAVKAAAPFSGAPEEVAVILPIRFYLD